MTQLDSNQKDFWNKQLTFSMGNQQNKKAFKFSEY